jgi:hypothetical protein
MEARQLDRRGHAAAQPRSSVMLISVHLFQCRSLPVYPSATRTTFSRYRM